VRGGQGPLGETGMRALDRLIESSPHPAGDAQSACHEPKSRQASKGGGMLWAPGEQRASGDPFWGSGLRAPSLPTLVAPSSQGTGLLQPDRGSLQMVHCPGVGRTLTKH